jgi:hypothetical protein
MCGRKIVHIEVEDHRTFLDKVFNCDPKAKEATVVADDGTSYKGVANNSSAAIEVAVEKMNKDQK